MPETQYPRGKRYKWVEHDYDFLLALNEEQCSYCLSPSTVQLCLAELSEVAWKTRYFSHIDTPIDERIILDWQEKAILELMSGCCDDSLIQLTIQNNTQNNYAIRQTIINRYNGTDPNSINPNAPNDNWNGDGSGTRDAALCMALKNYFTQYLNDAINQAFANGFIGGALFATGLLLLTTGIGFIAGLYIISAAGAIAALISGFEKAELTIFVDQITCCARDALMGEPITRASWAECLDDCDVTGGAADLLAIYKIGLSSNWEVFINILGDAYVAAQAGVEDCPSCCPETTYTYNWEGNDPATSGDVTALSTSDIPVTDVPFEPPRSSGSYIFNFIGISGGHYFNGSDVDTNGATAFQWHVPDEVAGCTLVKVSIGESDALYAQAYVFVKQAGVWHSVGSPGVFSGAYAVHDLTLAEMGVTDIGVIVNTALTTDYGSYTGLFGATFN